MIHWDILGTCRDLCLGRDFYIAISNVVMHACMYVSNVRGLTRLDNDTHQNRACNTGLGDERANAKITWVNLWKPMTLFVTSVSKIRAIFRLMKTVKIEGS